MHEGSSMGVTEQSIVHTPQELRRQADWVITQYKQPAIVEEYLPGREFVVPVLGNGPKARVLGVMETRDNLTGFEQKQQWKDETFKPVDSGALRKKLSEIALAAYLAAECKDAARVDMRLDAADQPQIVEVNALSGLRLKSSAIPIVARQAGMTFPRLIGEILNHALERWGLV
jgi:D-alanine-D-alanine ligase